MRCESSLIKAATQRTRFRVPRSHSWERVDRSATLRSPEYGHATHEYLLTFARL